MFLVARTHIQRLPAVPLALASHTAELFGSPVFPELCVCTDAKCAGPKMVAGAMHYKVTLH
ncbi:hypothetical protein PGT21_013096 [Puccinia graminis f. sp. tritici]|uniref:Uncharacterized protein n=1 Tax=Puccinia graminis f. sp. tritici TaxID=56615 RepID=A0A5B0NBZ0_PUCGR|nr:hypothetical protein PGT21_013096 [Puccinia graminis f. sp. tritici]